MWKILQQEHPDDYVIGTGKLHSVRDLLKIACDHVGLNYQNHVVSNGSRATIDGIRPCCKDAAGKKQLSWEPSTDFATMIGSWWILN